MQEKIQIWTKKISKKSKNFFFRYCHTNTWDKFPDHFSAKTNPKITFCDLLQRFFNLPIKNARKNPNLDQKISKKSKTFFFDIVIKTLGISYSSSTGSCGNDRYGWYLIESLSKIPRKFIPSQKWKTNVEIFDFFSRFFLDHFWKFTVEIYR